MNTIGPAYALIVLQEVSARGLSEAALFENTALSKGVLEAGENIAMNDFLQLLINADAMIQDTPMGIIIGRRSNILVLGQAGIAAASSPNLRQGLQSLESYSRLHVSYLHIAVSTSFKGMTLAISFSQDVGVTERFHIETAFMLFQNFVETVVGEAVLDARYYVPYPRPDNADDYGQFIHGDMTFDHTETLIQIPRRVLDQASPFYDKDAWQQSQRRLSERIKTITSESSGSAPYSLHVQALLQAQEPPLPTLSQIADQLHLSERTLNRRLQEEKTNFREIKSSITHKWARQYLLDSQLSVDAIATALGYQDTANFRRAFRNKEACSPVEYRNQRG
ncbi:AraC family transcriptional regulator [Pseudomaricurvus alkylphenolicus]|jgi:AraC-like DNA-binding protein|uniref:helix-turn-helix domain-containing protein n=1 Tax=Pseudomaricurvus alkylphenolicus TaxID=1306991 RepID=UPI0014201177|nr:AraC family transcriptional regulator [Pseudomaricurvus alkylphenolicus]NIB40584.1 AraC family transcriptional regulator [Pseudomaricurvus alkylphenolicus]